MPSRELKSRVVGAFADVAGETDDGGALFDTTGQGQLRRLPLDQVHPRADQPRQSMDPEALDELAASVRERGVLQPIRVRPREAGGYEIIAGERRWRAAQLAGLRDIPAVVASSDDDQAYVEALIENIQREVLNLGDRAQALKRLRVTLGLQSWEEVGQRLGISRIHVHRLLNVTRLPEPIQEDIRAGDLTEKHGRALLQLRGWPAQQGELWRRIQAESLSGDSALLVAKALKPTPVVVPPPEAVPTTQAPSAGSGDLAAAAQGLRTALEAAAPGEVEAVRDLLSDVARRIAALIDGHGEPPRGGQ